MTYEPQWSARHYHAILRIWKKATDICDKPLAARCLVAINYLLDRMTLPADLARLETKRSHRNVAFRRNRVQAQKLGRVDRSVL